MADTHPLLEDAKHQIAWILWLLARLDQNRPMGGSLDDLVPDDGSKSWTLEPTECRTSPAGAPSRAYDGSSSTLEPTECRAYPIGAPLKIGDVTTLATAAKRNIERYLEQPGT